MLGSHLGSHCWASAESWESQRNTVPSLWLCYRFLQDAEENNPRLCSWTLWVRNLDSAQHGQHGSASPHLGPLGGGLEDLGLVHSCVCGWCRLWTETLAGASSCHLASSQYGGWISKVSIPRESHVLWTRLGNHTGTLTASYWLRTFQERNRVHLLKEECWHYTEGRTWGWICISAYPSLKNATGHKNLDIEVIIRKMPSIGLRRLQGSWPSTWTRKRVSY